MTDPIADMLVADPQRDHRPASPRRYAVSRLKVEIASILESEGYIQGFKVLEPKAGERVRRSSACC